MSPASNNLSSSAAVFTEAPAPRTPRKRLPQAAPSPAAPSGPDPGKVAKIRTLTSPVKARGFTFGRGQTVPGVPLAHAEYLKGKGEAEILEVS